MGSGDLSPVGSRGTAPGRRRQTGSILMSLIDTRRDQVFPTLTPAQMATARRFASGRVHHFAPNEIIFRAGDMHVPAFLVLSGSLEVHRRDTVGRESLIVAHGPGQMSGEV